MHIGFTNNDNKVQAPIVEGTFTNAICYGQTGSGKTSGFILPNIENRIKLGHGLLIYDFKGTLHTQVKHLAKKYNKLDIVYEIGKPWGVEMDILKYATPKILNEIISATAGDDKNDYWQKSAAKVFSNIFLLLKEYQLLLKEVPINRRDENNNIIETDNVYYPNIYNIFRIVRSAQCVVSFFKEFEEQLKHMDMMIELKLKSGKKSRIQENQIIQHRVNINDHYEALSEYHKMDIEGDVIGGKNGVLQVLSQVLMGLYNKKCFNNDEFDVVDNLHEGNIIIINLEDFDDDMINLFNLTIYDKLKTKNFSLTTKKPVTIFIDEAQKVLNHLSLPDVDFCRELKFEFIFATQDLSLIESKIGTHNAYLLTRNVISAYSFKTIEPQDTKINTSKLKEFEYVDMRAGIKYLSDPIFINKKDIFNAERYYQKFVKAFDFIDIDYHAQNCIIKYSAQMDTTNKLILYFYDEDKYIEVERDNGNKLLEQYHDGKFTFIAKRKSNKRFDRLEELLDNAS